MWNFFIYLFILLLGLKNEVYNRVTPRLSLVKLVLTELWNDLTIKRNELTIPERSHGIPIDRLIDIHCHPDLNHKL